MSTIIIPARIVNARETANAWIDTESAARALRDNGYTVIADTDLPKMTSSDGGRPKLPSMPFNPDDEAHGGRVGFYRMQAAQSLALANWYEKKAEKERRDRDALELSLATLAVTHADLVARQLITEGWRR